MMCFCIEDTELASYLSILFLGDQLCKQNIGEFGHI